MDGELDAVMAMARRQSGVVSRAQALSRISGGTLRWLVSSGRWQRLAPGVYAVHRGPLTWRMRAQAALLHAGDGACLAGVSAAHVHGFAERQPPVITIAIPHRRRVTRVPGIRVVRRTHLVAELVSGLPVTSAADTVLDCCCDRLLSERDVVALVAEAVACQATTADAVAETLRARARHPRRRIIQLAVGDVDVGAQSVLEVMALRRVIRAHDLPTMAVQVPADGGRVRRDFENERFGVVLEVDGRRGHEGAGRIADLRRDRRASRDGLITLRAGWVDVDFEPCDLALDLYGTYVSRGYTGDIEACSARCPVNDVRRRRVQRLDGRPYSEGGA